jgi:hypothetical protein
VSSTTDNHHDWNVAHRHLATWDSKALLALIRDLYQITSINREFIHARCQAGERSSDALETYRCKIVEQFFPTRGFGKLKLGEARKAIRDYHKATEDVTGVAELLMTYVENGTQFTREFGDINERFYDSVESVLVELATLLRGEGQTLYPQFRDRLARLEKMAEDIGWGFGDFVGDVVQELDIELRRS